MRSILVPNALRPSRISVKMVALGERLVLAGGIIYKGGLESAPRELDATVNRTGYPCRRKSTVHRRAQVLMTVRLGNTGAPINGTRRLIPEVRTNTTLFLLVMNARLERILVDCCRSICWRLQQAEIGDQVSRSCQDRGVLELLYVR
jgi:hypothetical protein